MILQILPAPEAHVTTYSKAFHALGRDDYLQVQAEASYRQDQLMQNLQQLPLTE